MSKSLIRNLAMLELIPKYPSSITTVDIQNELREKGFEISIRSIQRDLELISSILPLLSETSEIPFRWSFTGKESPLFKFRSLDHRLEYAFLFSILKALYPEFFQALQYREFQLNEALIEEHFPNYKNTRNRIHFDLKPVFSFNNASSEILRMLAYYCLKGQMISVRLLGEPEVEITGEIISLKISSATILAELKADSSSGDDFESVFVDLKNIQGIYPIERSKCGVQIL